MKNIKTQQQLNEDKKLNLSDVSESKKSISDKAFIVYNYSDGTYDSTPGISLIWAKDIDEVKQLTKDWKTDAAGTIIKHKIDIIPIEKYTDKINDLDRSISFFD